MFTGKNQIRNQKFYRGILSEDWQICFIFEKSYWYCHITVYSFLNQILLPILSLANICPTNWQENEFKTKQLKKLLINQLICLIILTTVCGSDGAQACSKQIISFFICHMEHLRTVAYESLLKKNGWTSRATSPPSSVPIQATGKYDLISSYFSGHILWLGSSKNLWHFIQICVALKFLVWSSSRQDRVYLLSKSHRFQYSFVKWLVFFFWFWFKNLGVSLTLIICFP